MMNEIKALRKPLSERLPEEVFNTLHNMVGEASMCWEDIDHAGVFKAKTAADVAFELCHYVADLIDAAKEEAGDESVCYVTGEGNPLLKPMLLLQIREKLKVANR